tara:strand:- start:1267 stop:1566 length:300 start_codon:yes stop_codon:yes gene_type:complete
MAKKTKMILRNDPAKNRKSECIECGHELKLDPVDYRPITQDMMDFINKQEHWADHHSPSICWGMLEAVFGVVFTIAPNKEDAVQLITDCMAYYVEEADA